MNTLAPLVQYPVEVDVFMYFGLLYISYVKNTNPAKGKRTSHRYVYAVVQR